ncbi:hypothetical protein F511_20092 [Dorcoceras hygrometricum]|uniref:Uncharacterized protein n=1 Tax=Dorcoceras hygrometricum TaxID=472368 RepID=A0A2Z7BNK0_9LAMI|nr:hypothetical protein F511_20092 [Dorcoceras hygrometricum]
MRSVVSKHGSRSSPRRLAPTNFTRKLALQRLAVVVLLIRSTTGITTPSSVYTRKHEESFTGGISSSRWSEQVQPRQAAAHGGGRRRVEEAAAESGRGRRGAAMSRVWSVLYRQCSPRSSINRHVMGLDRLNGPGVGPGPYEHSVQVRRRGSIIIPIDDQIGPIYTVYKTGTCVTLNGSGIQLAVGPQQLRLRNHNFGLTHRIMVKRPATSPHDPLGITDSSCKNQSVMVSVQYGSFNTYIPIRSTIIGKSRVARDPITMHTSWRSNSDIACVTRRTVNPRQRSIDSYMHRDLTQSRHLMTPTESVKRVKVRHLSCRVSMTFRVVRADLYNQDLDLSTRQMVISTYKGERWSTVRQSTQLVNSQTVNSAGQQSDSQLSWSTVRQSTQLVNSQTVNSAGQQSDSQLSWSTVRQSTQLVNSQTVNSAGQQSDSQLSWSTVRQSTQLVNSQTVNSAGQQSTHLWIGQLSFGLVNSALDGQFIFEKVNSAHEFQQVATRVTNQITSGKPIVTAELKRLMVN